MPGVHCSYTSCFVFNSVRRIYIWSNMFEIYFLTFAMLQINTIKYKITTLRVCSRTILCLIIECRSLLWKLCKGLFWCKKKGLKGGREKGGRNFWSSFFIKMPFLVNIECCPKFQEYALTIYWCFQPNLICITKWFKNVLNNFCFIRNHDFYIVTL